MICLKNITKTYTTKHGVKTTALKDLNIQFGDRGLVFILGQSGSGKSTLLNLLGGIDQPTAGELVVDGVSSKAFTDADYDGYRNTYVGFVFQEYNLISKYTVEKNIALALELQHRAADKQAIEDVLRKVALVDERGNTLAKRKVEELSGGQRQRVAIARALIKAPKLILADEPTGALDSKTGEALYELLKTLSKEKLIVVVTHDEESARRYGDRIVEMEDGKVIGDETVAEPLPAREEKEKKLIRSKLPLLRAFTMGAAGLKYGVFRLIVAVILCIASFTTFGYSVTAYGMNVYNTQFRAMTERGLEYFVMQSTNVRFDEIGEGKLQTVSLPFTQEQLELLNDYNGEALKVAEATGVYREENGFRRHGIESYLGVEEEAFKRQKNEYVYYQFIDYGLQHVVEVNADMGASEYKLTAHEAFVDGTLCALPKTTSEIAITDLHYAWFAEFGYREADGSVTQIRTPDDMIGKPLGDYTVCGVYQTEIDIKEYLDNKTQPTGYNGTGWAQKYYGTRESVLNFGYVCKGACADAETERVLLRYNGDARKTERLVNALTYENENTEFGGWRLVTVYVAYLPAEDFFEKTVNLAIGISIVLAAVATLLLSSYLTIGIQNRSKELGILRALGARKQDVVNICLSQSLLVALMAFVPSLIGTILVTNWSNQTYMLPFFSVGFLPIALLVLFCFGVAALSTVLPVWRVAKRQPVDVIKNLK